MTPPRRAHAAGMARRLGIATVLDTIGTGVYFTAFPLFLIRSRGLRPQEIGLALGLASACGLIAGPLIGHLADRTALRPVLVRSYLVQFLGAAALPFCASYPLIVGVLCLNTAASEGGRAVRYAVIARLGGSGRVALRARLRVMTNVGLSIGTLFGGIAAQTDSRPAYTIALLGNAASFALVAAVQRGLPRMPAVMTREPVDARAPRRNKVANLVSPRYVLIAAINGVLFLETRILTLGVPLWVATHSQLPRWSITVAFLVNTLLVVALQVQFSRGVTSPAAASRSWLRAGAAFLLSCAILPLSVAVGAGWSLVVLTLAVAVHTCGEMWHMAGSFELALGMAPAAAQGRYQGVFNLGEGISMVAGPVVTSLLSVSLGVAGWLIMGGILAAAGGAGAQIVRWAVDVGPPGERSRDGPETARVS